jgi:hypothetical protein
MDWPNILIGAIAGGGVGFLLVYLVDWLWRPRVKEYKFIKEGWNFGTLYKLNFTLKGRSQPGLCALTIQWSSNKGVFAKWDETPNPLEADDPNIFRAELVPSTYYLPLFLKRPYSIPILNKADGSYEVFSGWWFGRNNGYGPNPRLSMSDNLTLTLTGGNFTWSKIVSVDTIVRQGENHRG